MITTAQQAADAVGALHDFAHSKDHKLARVNLSQGGIWTLTALHYAVRRAYPDTAYSTERHVPSSLDAARSLVSGLHIFLCGQYQALDPCPPLIEVAAEVAFAAVQVLQDDQIRARA